MIPSDLTMLQRKFFQSVSSQYVSYISAEMSGATKPSSICSRGVSCRGSLERVRQAMVAVSPTPVFEETGNSDFWLGSVSG